MLFCVTGRGFSESPAPSKTVSRSASLPAALLPLNASRPITSTPMSIDCTTGQPGADFSSLMSEGTKAPATLERWVKRPWAAERRITRRV